MVSRLRSLIANPSGRAFPQTVDATRFRWVDGDQADWRARGPLPRHPDLEAHTRIFQAALWTVTAGRILSADVRDWLGHNVVARPQEELLVIQAALDRIRSWRIGRTRGPRTTVAETSNQPATAAAVSSTLALSRQDTSASSSDAEDAQLDVESMYEPPGSDLSAGYVSPGWTEDEDLGSDASSPSRAASSEDADGL